MTRNYAVKHGHSRRSGWSHEYIAWKNMIARCERPSAERYKNYGARGIKVCNRWRDSFSDFLADMGPRPSSRHSIGRIDVDKGYSPANCRWELAEQQHGNRTDTKYLTVQGTKLTLSQAAEKFGIPYNTLKRRLLRGWSDDEAVSRPLRIWPGSKVA